MTETAGQFTMWSPDGPLERRTSANGRRSRAIDCASATRTPACRSDPARSARPDEGATIARATSIGPKPMPRRSPRWVVALGRSRLDQRGGSFTTSRASGVIRVGGENLARRGRTGDPRCDRHAASAFWACRRAPRRSADGGGGRPRRRRLAARADRLRATLAGFKIPRAVYGAAIPLTATNRVQRRVLRDWIVAGKLERVA